MNCSQMLGRSNQQFSLAAVMLGTTCIAVAFAVLPRPFVAYYLLLTLFFVAAILFRIGPLESRPFWRWFAVCGWLYAFIGISLIEVFESTSLWFSIRSWLERKQPIALWNGLPKDYLIFAHSVIALSLALAGGVSIPRLIGSPSRAGIRTWIPTCYGNRSPHNTARRARGGWCLPVACRPTRLWVLSQNFCRRAEVSSTITKHVYLGATRIARRRLLPALWLIPIG